MYKIVIHVKAGDGGVGAISFFRSKSNLGGPSGGNGGNGGNVYIQGSDQISNFNHFYRKWHWKAEDGGRGGHKKLTGRNGKDLIIPVPLGTHITELNLDIMNNTPHLLLTGGKGGIGNASLCTSTERLPDYNIPHTLGEEKTFQLTLKTIGDIGLVGMPNAGKSSLINAVCKVKFKVGDYAFSTTYSQVATLNGIKFVDIPGIMEGAHEGKGLGLQWLQHMERTLLILIVIDITQDPWETFNVLLNELDIYGIDKEYIIVLNKIDLISRRKVMEIKKQFLGYNVICTSAKYKSISKLKKIVLNKIDKVKNINNIPNVNTDVLDKEIVYDQ
jgi:GTP-binding protein